MAVIKWTGVIQTQTFRVIDMGVGITPRVQVEIQQQPDLMGVRGWSRFDPIPVEVFSAMLIAAGVVT